VLDDQIHWVRKDLEIKEGEQLSVMARIRYRQPLEQATLYRETNGLYVMFDSPQTAISEGQYVAWYKEEELLGSGVIS
jgi:tRNA-specific 2-thiouridylase